MITGKKRAPDPRFPRRPGLRARAAVEMFLSKPERRKEGGGGE